MQCQSCGRWLPPGAAVCPACGMHVPLQATPPNCGIWVTTGELLYPGYTRKATARERSSTSAGISGNNLGSPSIWDC